MSNPSHDCVALVVELVDTRDLKSLGVRAVPVQVRPGAPSYKNDVWIQYPAVELTGRVSDHQARPGAPSNLENNNSERRLGRVAMQRIANPWTSVRLREAPPKFLEPVYMTGFFIPADLCRCVITK